MMNAAPALSMSLADVARLAGVQRPVASMWRRRPLNGRPFPKPVEVVGAQERFDAFEIADYLAATGRGKHTVSREDVAAHAALSRVGRLSEVELFDGLTALLTLEALAAEGLSDLSIDEIRALSADLDPDDGFLKSEIDALGTDAQDVAKYAAALADASFSPGAAFELLLRQHVGRRRTPQAVGAFQATALQLGGRVVASLISQAGWRDPLIVDVTGGVGDLLLESARVLTEADAPPTVATLSDRAPSARLAQRRMCVHDLHRVGVAVDDAGDVALDSRGYGGVVHVAQLPVDAEGSSDEAILDAVDNLLVQLSDDARLVVLAPASALTDAPASSEVDRSRDAVLRSGRLRAAIRLPAGLMMTQPRRSLALWVLGPAHRDIAIADRWTTVGDLTGRRLDESTIADVVVDVTAALGRPRDAVRHSYRFARPVLTARLIAGRRSLVAATQPRGSAALTADDAIRKGLCRVVSGSRVDSADLVAEGRQVIGPEELLGQTAIGARAVDPLAFPAAYPASRYTEPGDVVWCSSPRAAAWVDRAGGSVVLSPARVMRIDVAAEGERMLVPDVVAADIAASTGKDWRRWSLRTIRRDDYDELTTALAGLSEERDRLTSRIVTLDATRTRLIAAATRTRPEGI